MKQIHKNCMSRTLKSIELLKMAIKIINNFRGRISHKVLTETLMKKKQKIKREIQNWGYPLDSTFEEICMSMESPNFDLLLHFTKQEQMMRNSQRDQKRYQMESEQEELKVQRVKENELVCKKKKIKKNKKVNDNKLRAKEKIHEQSDNSREQFLVS